MVILFIWGLRSIRLSLVDFHVAVTMPPCPRKQVGRKEKEGAVSWAHTHTHTHTHTINPQSWALKQSSKHVSLMGSKFHSISRVWRPQTRKLVQSSPYCSTSHCPSLSSKTVPVFLKHLSSSHPECVPVLYGGNPEVHEKCSCKWGSDIKRVCQGSAEASHGSSDFDPLPPWDILMTYKTPNSKM